MEFVTSFLVGNFADDSCDAFMNSSVQNGDSSDDLSENDDIRQVASDDCE